MASVVVSIAILVSLVPALSMEAVGCPRFSAFFIVALAHAIWCKAFKCPWFWSIASPGLFLFYLLSGYLLRPLFDLPLDILWKATGSLGLISERAAVSKPLQHVILVIFYGIQALKQVFDEQLVILLASCLY